MAKPLLSFLKKNYLFVLVFVLLGVFLIHDFDTIGQDLGRHLKVGEIIWQTKEVPKTNLFSFTEPDFPFINHHWLSEVIFFGIFSYTGFIGLTFVKTVLVFVAFLLLFFVARIPLEVRPAPGAWSADDPSKRGVLPLTGWSILISFLLSVFIFIQRTEVRPEIFSFVLLSFFLFAIFKAKYEQEYRFVWILPILQLFWVNLHIYFFVGPFLLLAFLIDRLVAREYMHIKKITTVLFLTFVATLINPNGIQGALLPLKVLNKYGYSIVENQTLSFLADFGGFLLPVLIFKLSVAILAISFLFTVKKVRQRVFEIIILVFFIYAGFRMLRNLPLYALASFPVLAILLTDVFDSVKIKFFRTLLKPCLRRVPEALLKGAVLVFLISMIFFVANDSYYRYMEVSRVSGVSVPNGLKRAVDFVKQNKIKGPMFNNFDIGGYLVWQLYPQEKVFVDNRPEAYSVKFFSEIYQPMQENKDKWLEFSEKYGINFIFFGHTDTTPWGQEFLNDIVKNQDWKIVYLNEDAIILVKNEKKNSEIISKLSITDKTSINKISDFIKDSNMNKANLNLILSRVLFKINWLEPSVYFADEVIKIDPKNPYPYLHKGFVHIYYSDKQNQQLAEENIKKAIDLGLKESQYYFILGVVYMNLGRLESARVSLKEAVRLDKNNTQAREFLDKYFK